MYKRYINAIIIIIIIIIIIKSVWGINLMIRWKERYVGSGWLASLTEWCSFQYGLKDLSPLHKLAEKIVLDP